jgi:tRNA-specific 2-thiouridylase
MKQTSPKKIMAAMSGGVDSSVTVALLKQQGWQVHGVFMALAQPDLPEQVERVEKIAKFLSVPLDVVDLSQDFNAKVLDYFSASYAQGRTPNPCVICNPLIKFGKLLEYGKKISINMMATGHYVRVENMDDGRVRLLKGLDPKKDQSYFLCGLSQAQLKKLYFPLGMTEKEKVYEMAASLGLDSMHGAESQDVCFLKEQSVEQFLVDRIPESQVDGDIVSQDGKVLGTHKGIFRYTVGQRRGLGIPDATPYYVIGLDPQRNRVIVGKKDELWRDSLVARNINWTGGVEPKLQGHYSIKIRYRHEPAEAMVEQAPDGIAIKFTEPQRAITPGQFAVLYQDDELLGGGEIS